MSEGWKTAIMLVVATGVWIWMMLNCVGPFESHP